MEKPKFAFTARAFYYAVKKYGSVIFTSIEKPLVVENTLIKIPETINVDTSNDWTVRCISQHWQDFQSPPPWGLDESREELKILAKLDTLYADNVKIVYSTLAELSFLNKVYGNDELLNVSELGAWLG